MVDPDMNIDPDMTDVTKQDPEIERLTAEAQANLDGWKRAMADLENVKRRHDETMSALIERRQAEIFRAILPVVDDLRRLVAHLPSDQSDQFVNGAKSILKKADDALAKMGLEAIDLDGKQFDPNEAEAISEIDSDLPAGKVVEVLETGYRSGEHLVRPARVVVSRGPTN